MHTRVNNSFPMAECHLADTVGRPYRTNHLSCTPNPGINSWAIFVCPSGTSSARKPFISQAPEKSQILYRALRISPGSSYFSLLLLTACSSLLTAHCSLLTAHKPPPAPPA